MKNIGLFPNLKRDAGLESTKEVIRTLAPFSVTLFASREIQNALGDEGKLVEFVTEDELFEKSDCLVTLGGDGTILSVARRAAQFDLPIFGINLGHVGFMAALEKKEIRKISRLVTGSVHTSSRMLLSCFVNGEEKLCALNEFVIAPEKGFHIVELSLYTGRRKLCDFRADGLIFNTPTGSTGYSFSAGGAVMDADFDAIGVKAISSYLLMGAHHMVFAPETVFTAKNCRSEGSKITVCADGREEVTISNRDEVKICRSEKRVRLITLKKQSNQEVFFRKF